MSFSSEVKKELIGRESQPRHCTIAQLAGMLGGTGRIRLEQGRAQIIFTSENEKIAQTFARLAASVNGACGNVPKETPILQKSKTSYPVVLKDEEAEKLLQALKMPKQPKRVPANRLLLQKSCCKRAFLRGIFLAAGSMSDPKKSYHLEIVCESLPLARQIQEQFGHFGLDAKTVSRKNHEVVYLKEGAQIVDALNVMGAHMALMDLENVRILKEMRNDINRRVNCETANIHKTVSAAYRQQQAIRFLQQQGALAGLADALKEIAMLRMEYPEAAIQELGALCIPKVGKSGVNHRLRKLEETARQMGYEKKE